MRIILNIAILSLLPATVHAGEAPPDLLATPDAAVEARLHADPPAPPLEHGKAFTGDATTVEPGRVEVEIAYAPSWWATAGAVDRLSGEQHQVAAAVAVRWRFLSLADPSFDLAVSAGVTVPTGTRAAPDHLGTSRESWSLGGSLLASLDRGPFTFGAELGYSAPVGPRTSNDAGLLVCNAAVGYQVVPWLQPELEVNYQHEIELGPQPDERVLWATAALVIPMDAVRLVVGARFPVWARDADVGPMATAAAKFAF